MIAEAVGDRTRAVRYLSRALDANPYFDVKDASLASSTLKDIAAGRASSTRPRTLMQFTAPLVVLGLLGVVIIVGVVVFARRTRTD